MPVRLLHTADWQIGMTAAHTGKAAKKVREARFRAAARLAEVARGEGVDFAILAGDTFENNAVSLGEVERTAEILAGFPCPVYVLPGNHDPLEPGAVWDRPVWRAFNHIRILRAREPVDAGAAVLFPCPLTERWSGEDPTAWIPAGTHENRIRIGIAHGTLASVPAADRAHPIPADAAWARRLDYLALGDWHSLQIFGDPQRGCRMAYSGTPEPTAFGERDSGQALVVEIAEPLAAPRLRAVPTGELEWLQRGYEIAHPGQLGEALREIESLRSSRALLDLRLSGTLFPEDAGQLEAIRGLEGEFLHLRMDDSQLVPAVELSQGEIRDPIVCEAARRLRERMQEGPEAAVARLAAQTLLRLAKGVGA